MHLRSAGRRTILQLGCRMPARAEALHGFQWAVHAEKGKEMETMQRTYNLLEPMQCFGAGRRTRLQFKSYFNHH